MVQQTQANKAQRRYFVFELVDVRFLSSNNNRSINKYCNQKFQQFRLRLPIPKQRVGKNQRIYNYTQILSKQTYKIYYTTSAPAMQKKNNRQKRGINDCKQNMTQNSEFGLADLKHKNIRKHKQQSVYPLSEVPRNRDPQQLRYLCEQQEKQVLAEYRASCMVQHSQFYEYVRGELADSDICDKIMHIKHMTNEEAVEEFLRVQHKAKISERQTEIHAEAEERVVFRHLGKKMSMIEQNDDAYLEELGGLQIDKQSGQAIVDELESHYQQPQPQPKSGQYSSFSQHQYYQNDDLFEF